MFACNRSATPPSSEGGAEKAAEKSGDTFNIGLVLDRGGKDDKSFNASAFAGAMRAEKELGVSIKTVEATDNNAFESLHRSFAQRDFDLIIGIGFAQADAVKKVAALFPDKKFAIVDSEVEGANVRSLMFEEHEGSYLVGAIAALQAKSGKVGFIGGMDIPLIRRFQMGYEEGVKKINPKASITVNYVGVTSEAWNNPPKARELALSQYQQGVDVIFAAAGASGNGVFDAAEEKKKLAIGVDSNQNWMKPGFILTSMLKRVDEAVYETIKATKAGQFAAGTQRFGLGNRGVDYAVDQYNEGILSPESRKKADELKQEIIAGTIQVRDFYKVKK